MKCPSCHRPSLEVSADGNTYWCRYVADCGYSSRLRPDLPEPVWDRATLDIASRVLPVRGR